MTGTPIRRAARALILDETQRVLLFRGEPAGRRPWWFAPGGALDPGETYEDAAVREVMEETGLVVALTELSPPVWVRDVAFVWNGVVERHIEQFFLIRVPARTVDMTRFEPSEIAGVRVHRWWTIDEITRSDDLFAPADFGTHLEPLLRGELPQRPEPVGE